MDEPAGEHLFLFLLAIAGILAGLLPSSRGTDRGRATSSQLVAVGLLLVLLIGLPAVGLSRTLVVPLMGAAAFGVGGLELWRRRIVRRREAERARPEWAVSVAQPSSDACGRCEGALRVGQRLVACVTCGGGYHGACAGDLPVCVRRACGRPAAPAAPPRPSWVGPLAEEPTAATTCPLCREALAGEERVACRSCRTGFHAACAAELPGCTTLGCGNAGRRRLPA